MSHNRKVNSQTASDSNMNNVRSSLSISSQNVTQDSRALQTRPQRLSKTTQRRISSTSLWSWTCVIVSRSLLSKSSTLTTETSWEVIMHQAQGLQSHTHSTIRRHCPGGVRLTHRCRSNHSQATEVMLTGTLYHGITIIMIRVMRTLHVIMSSSSSHSLSISI